MVLPATPKDIPDAIAAAWNARDAQAFAALFAEDADFVNVVGLWWRNRADIEKAHAYGFAEIFKKAAMKVTRTRIRLLSDTAAVIVMRWRMTDQNLPGSDAETGVRRGLFTLVTQKSDAGWQIVSAQNTDIVQGAETLIADEDGMRPADYRKS